MKEDGQRSQLLEVIIPHIKRITLNQRKQETVMQVVGYPTAEELTLACSHSVLYSASLYCRRVRQDDPHLIRTLEMMKNCLMTAS